MGLEVLSEAIRGTDWAKALAEKISPQHALRFDYWGQFRRLRDQVSAEVGGIPSLLPEFTPHNEEHHLMPLIVIADKMLGAKHYEKMNAGELFLLGCGLYTHDWGMAVGQDEITSLSTGATTVPPEARFAPLPDERQQLEDFANRYGLTRPGNETPLDKNYLQLYVRETHARRSGARAEAFFRDVNQSVGRALKAICEGHNLSFRQLEDEDRYPRVRSVLSEEVNLCAVTVYVRLVDLFDIGEDRTPSAIRRFVAPRDARAQVEWEKHRCLNPVIFGDYGDGRAVHVDGSADTPEIWAQLEDLRIYCQDQLNGAMDLLAHRSGKLPQLDLRKLEWKVAAEGFEPITIQFGFDRQQMFRILCEEIYQRDNYVFLRELLQNSIDAIKLRRDWYRRDKRHDAPGPQSEAIYFTVERLKDDDAIVRCRDFGIGMDEYIVRNYLAVAGVSYYSSEDFHRLGLKMDPIAQYGIGILSCFMVADRVEIETYRDPNLGNGAKPLRFDIPDVNRNFRCHVIDRRIEPGTTVTVHVLGNKLRQNLTSVGSEDRPAGPVGLRVVEYLAEIAGFVEFPIVVDEDNVRTVILHPDRDPKEAERIPTPPGYRIETRQLSKEYPWDEIFKPKDAYALDEAARTESMRTAEKFLNVGTYHLKRDFGLEGYEGWISYVQPKPDTTIGVSRGIGIRLEGPAGIVELEHADRWRRSKHIAPSAERKLGDLSVYRAGVLVVDPPDLSPDRLYSGAPLLASPVLRVNLTPQLAGPANVARRNLLRDAGSWHASIRRGVANCLRQDAFSEVHGLAASVCFDKLASLMEFWDLGDEDVAALLPGEDWPLPTLRDGGQVAIEYLPVRKDQTFSAIPDLLEDAVLDGLGWARFGDFGPLLSYWRGERAVAFPFPRLREGDFRKKLLERLHYGRIINRVPVSVKFVNAPIAGFAPLVMGEFVFAPRAPGDTTPMLEQAMLDPSSLSPVERSSLPGAMYRLFDATPFPPPFDGCFAWGGQYFNLSHPTVIGLFRCAAATEWYRREGKKSSTDLDRIRDCLMKMSLEFLSGPTETLYSMFKALWQIVRQSRLIDLHKDPAWPDAQDYVWGSLDWGRRALPDPKKIPWEYVWKYLRPFGEVLTNPAPEELPAGLLHAMRSNTDPR